MGTGSDQIDGRFRAGSTRPASSREAHDVKRLWPTPLTIMTFSARSPFASLGDEILTALLGIAVRRNFVNGQTIHMQDDEARFLNVIIAGHVRLSYAMEDGSVVLHAVLPSGETFGELGVFDRSVYADTANAVGPVSLVSLPAAALLDLTRGHPALSDALARTVAVRYREYLAVVQDLSLPSLSARLARTLIRLADRLDSHTDQGDRPAQVIGAVVTQTDLGLMARGSRGNVNRALQAWQRAGWITLKHRSIIILNRYALAAITADP